VSASVLKTAVNTKSPEFEKNSQRMVELLTAIKNEEEEIRQGGGAKAIDSQHKKNRLTARERVAALIRVHTSLNSESTPRTKCTRNGAALPARGRLPAWHASLDACS
jgi:acetyl-CoA carboxylase carboxyltransferase component